MAISQFYAHHAVVVVDVDGRHTIGTRTGVVAQARLLDHASLGAEDDVVAFAELGVAQLAYVEAGVHGVVGHNVEHVLYGTALGVLRALGNVVHLEPVAASLGGEEEHGVVHRGGIDVLNEVGIAGSGSL